MQGVQPIAHSPLGDGQASGGPLSHSAVLDVSKRLGVSPASVLIKWSLQRGVPVIVDASTFDALKSDGDIFSSTLDEEVDKVRYCSHSSNVFCCFSLGFFGFF
jgi:diketogulonate reductase-like aldo/keto reductase